MSPEAKMLYRLISALRISFNRLKRITEDLHKDIGVNVPMRGVLESIHERAKTVPAIACEKGVSRQHIQVNVDALLEVGMVEACSNPEHQRSVLISLTKRGQRVFADIRNRETAILNRLGQGLKTRDLSDAAATLEALNTLLVQYERTQDDDDNNTDDAA